MALLANAKKIAPAAKPPKGKAKAEIQIAGVESLAMVDALQKALDTIRDTLDADVKGAALSRFMQVINDTGQRPESFRGVEGGASASLELRRRGSNLALNEGQVALLREYGLEPAKAVSVPELYGINPCYASNAELMDKVEKALTGIVPDDFIVLQEEQFKHTATDDVLAQACAKKAPAEVVLTLTTLACKPKLESTNMEKILDFVRGLIVGQTPLFGDAVAPQIEGDGSERGAP